MEWKLGQAFVEFGHKIPHFVRDVFVKEGYDIRVWDYFGREFGVNRDKLIMLIDRDISSKNPKTKNPDE